MIDIIDRLTTLEECEQLRENVQKENPELAMRARRKAVELRAAKDNAETAAEREAMRAVYAYEEGLSVKNGRKTRASRTRQMIKKHGIIGAVERAVNRKTETQGYTILVEMGMQDFAFEHVVLRYPDLFSQEAIDRSKERVEQMGSGNIEKANSDA
jgi:hypothetical protein